MIRETVLSVADRFDDVHFSAGYYGKNLGALFLYTKLHHYCEKMVVT